MSRMMWVASGLALTIAAIFGGLYLKPESTSTPSGNSAAKPVAFNKALADRGEQVASSNGCVSCHTTDGAKSVGPTWKGIYGTEADIGGKTVKVNAEFIETATNDPNAQVRSGFGPSMPSFKGKLSGQDIRAIVEYIKSLNG